MSQVLKLLNRLTYDQKKFIAELFGTFIVVAFATGSVVINAKYGGVFGLPLIAFAPFVGVAIGVYLFGRISMAHFNPAVTVGYFITSHITLRQLPKYLAAEIIGAILASIFVKHILGDYANLGANVPNYNFPIPVIFAVELVATAILMSVILVVVYSRGLKGFSGIAIGGIIGLDILFFSFISGASMNPARSLAPALLSGTFGDLWLYCSATFIGTSIVALFLRKKFV